MNKHLLHILLNRATVVEDHEVWYMDDGLLSLVLCEDVRESDIDQPDKVEKCCACEDAMYEVCLLSYIVTIYSFTTSFVSRAAIFPDIRHHQLIPELS